MKSILTLCRRASILLLASFSCFPLHAISIRVLAWDSEIATMKLAIGDSNGSRPIKDMHPSRRTGSEKKVVPIPPTWNPVQEAPGGEARNMEVKIYFREDPYQPISSSIWEHDPDERMLVFIIPGNDLRLGPVAMKMIPENRKLIEQAAAAKSAGP